jgi:hypothetical protein
MTADRSTDATQPSMELGDIVHHALASVGITELFVASWLGRSGGGGCGCDGRRRRLNDLSRWAKRFVSGRADELGKMKEVLVNMTSDP